MCRLIPSLWEIDKERWYLEEVHKNSSSHTTEKEIGQKLFELLEKENRKNERLKQKQKKKNNKNNHIRIKSINQEMKLF